MTRNGCETWPKGRLFQISSMGQEGKNPREPLVASYRFPASIGSRERTLSE